MPLNKERILKFEIDNYEELQWVYLPPPTNAFVTHESYNV